MDTTNQAASVPTDKHMALYDEVGALVNQAGGVAGIAQQFQQKGLGGLIQGWISNGPNPAIGGEQVIDLIGKDRVTALASKMGLTEEQVASSISTILPKVIDGMTPNGTVPNHTPGAYETAFNIIKSKVFGA